MKASSTKDKKNKNKKGKGNDAKRLDDGDEAPIEGDDAAEEESSPQKAKEMTAEELADEEWGPTKAKGKKGKKKAAEVPEDKEAEGLFIFYGWLWDT